jgi:glycosyltransferase involved in cell wall biosynthesis
MRIGLDLALPLLRRWDYATAQRVDRFIAISSASRDAIRKYYKRDADVIFAPILGLPDEYVPATKQPFFLVVSRLEKWKRIDIVVKAFSKLGERLVIVGAGPERGSLESMAGPNIEFAGAVSEERLIEYYRSALAVVHVTETEYGLVPIEANAYGTPAICYGASGVLETMVPYAEGETGATALFFSVLTPESLAAAVKRFHEVRFDPVRLFQNAARFGKRAFIERIVSYVHAHMPDTKAAEASSG